MIFNLILNGLRLPMVLELAFSFSHQILEFRTIEQLILLVTLMRPLCVKLTVEQSMILWWKIFHSIGLLSLPFFPLRFRPDSVLFCSLKHRLFFSSDFIFDKFCLQDPLFIIHFVCFQPILDYFFFPFQTLFLKSVDRFYLSRHCGFQRTFNLFPIFIKHQRILLFVHDSWQLLYIWSSWYMSKSFLADSRHRIDLP